MKDMAEKLSDAGVLTREGIRLYEVAEAKEIERVHNLGPFNTRQEFKIISWPSPRSGTLEDIFNEMSVAGYSYVECTFCDGASGQYVFARRVPREVA